MIRRLIKNVFKRKSDAVTLSAKIIGAREHHIDQKHISDCALNIIKQLQAAHFQAFIVGGAVRDLLLGNTPKDFDVATNATPEQIRKIIRRSRVIGRRFQIIHAFCGQEIVEISTFRANSKQDSHHQQIDEHGRLTRDNVFGTLEEDAERRDFTMNALFYDPEKNQVLDFFDGVSHLRQKQLVMIGDPKQRYREDPVRMLRAARFCAKLNVHLSHAAKAPIPELSELLLNVPESRLFDELLKIVLSGHALKGIFHLKELGLIDHLVPSLHTSLHASQSRQFIEQALHNTDQRIQADMGVSPGFLMAALLWPPLLNHWNMLKEKGEKPIPSLFTAMQHALEEQKEVLMIPKRFDGVMKEIWGMQPRFEQRSGQRPFRLLHHPRFRASYDFLMLRVQAGEVDAAMGQWWTDFQSVSHEEQEAMLIKPERQAGSRQRRKKRS